MDKTKAVYLSKKQLARIEKGILIKVSRKGAVLFLGKKGAGAEEKKLKKIARLERALAILKRKPVLKVRKVSLRNFTMKECPICKKMVKKPKSHIALKHDGKPFWGIAKTNAARRIVTTAIPEGANA